MATKNLLLTFAGVCVLCVAAIALPAQTFTTLHSFDNIDGLNPQVALIQATTGNLYGTTQLGGNGTGTFFKITPSGTLTTLYTFCSQNCTDGQEPAAALVQASNGNFYGTTISGGAQFCFPSGCGTIFKVTAFGLLTTVYRFCAQGGVCTDGSDPSAALVQATDGNLYGTTSLGGTGSCYRGCGTVFKMTPSGTLTTLHSFELTDGANPLRGLVHATDGNFYGTTSGGAAYNFGTVFKITPGGALTTLHSFDGAESGPASTLVQAADGNFYGTTLSGGANGYGMVFEITPSGTLTTLYSFCPQSGCMDGQYPSGALVQATDGNFYGTTQYGGANDKGTVFKITSSGVLTTLYSFCSQSGCPDGENPYAGLVQDTNGNFYGTTYGGGANGFGTVFSLSVGLGPFVEGQPTSGKVGRLVRILGTKLTGASSVSFNGTAATFTVVSGSLITTTVPAGATTGKLHVTTPYGTLSSKVPFRVLP